MNSANSPEVSIVMASYNHAKFIAAAIESVLIQSMPDWELLIVDDGSTDSSQDIIQRYAEKDARLRFLRHPHGDNRGLPATVCLGLGHVRGRYIAFLESDDAWTADCLEKRLRRLNETDADAIFNHAAIVVDEKGKAGEFFLVQGVRKRFRECGPVFHLYDKLLFINVIPTFSCIMLKAEALTKVNFTPPVFRWLDWWLWLQVAENGRFTYLDEPCTIWRRHEMSYNRRLDIKRYIGDSKAMWCAMRHIAQEWKEKRTFYQRLFLRLPFYLYLMLRFAHMAGMNGSAGMMRRILLKFRSA